MKNKTKISIIASIVALTALSLVMRTIYLEHFKYPALEKEIRLIHQKMEKDIPKELFQQEDVASVLTKLTFPSTYGVGEIGNEITKEFEKAGIVSAQDQWLIVKETFIRSKVGTPFRLHRLIELENEAYKVKWEKKTLKTIADEFYVYQEFKGKLD